MILEAIQIEMTDEVKPTEQQQEEVPPALPTTAPPLDESVTVSSNSFKMSSISANSATIYD